MNRPTAEQIAKILQNLAEGDSEFLSELINAYIENLHEFRSEASVAVRNKNVHKLKAHLHKINPTFLTLNYRDAYDHLSNLTDKLEVQAVGDSIWQVESVTQELIDKLHTVRRRGLAG